MSNGFTADAIVSFEQLCLIRYSGKGLKDEADKLVGMMNDEGLRVVMEGLWKGGWKI